MGMMSQSQLSGERPSSFGTEHHHKTSTGFPPYRSGGGLYTFNVFVKSFAEFHRSDRCGLRPGAMNLENLVASLAAT